MNWFSVFLVTVAVAFSSVAAEDRDQTFVWQGKIDEASASGGGRVTVPAGRHLVGQLDLKDNVELHLEKGAILEGLTGLEHYRVKALTCSEGTWSAIVFAHNVTNVAVTGEGVIFGNGSAWPGPPAHYDGFSEGLRARGLFFGDCKGVRLEDFTLRDAACWGIVLKRSENVVACRVKVDNHANLNNDGFDIEARNVLIEGCDVDSGDDAYCVKSNDPDFIVENVIVRHCVGRSQCNVFKIGTASHGIIRNVLFEDCRCEPTRRDCMSFVPEDRGKPLFFKRVTPRAPFGAATSAVSIECVDGGLLEGIRVNGLSFENGVKVPLFIRGGTRVGRGTGARVGEWHVLRDVLIENLKGNADGCIPSSVTGVDGCRVQNIRLRNVDVVCHGAGEEESRRATVEPVPYRPGGYPTAVGTFAPSILPAYGLYVDRADNVILENVKFRLAADEVDLRSEIFGSVVR